MAETDEKPEKLQFLSLSCPRLSEFIIRAKITRKDKVICQRGNVEVLDEFFHQLELREIDQLRLHLLKIRPEDYKVFEEKLKNSGDYKVKGIIFNQSSNPQLIIDFSLKSSEILEYLLVKGYNQKYPCNKTDYVILVPTHNCAIPASILIKSQVPLLCQPIEWKHQEKKQFFLKKFPEMVAKCEFIVGTEFYFNETGDLCYPKTVSWESTGTRHLQLSIDREGARFWMSCCHRSHCDKKESQNTPSLRNYAEKSAEFRNENKRHSRAEKPLSVERVLFLPSDEEWDAADPSLRGILDMPIDILENILDHLPSKKKIALRRTCRSMHSFIDSKKFPLDHIVIKGDYHRTTDKVYSRATLVFKIGKVKKLDFAMRSDDFERLMEETANYGSMEVEILKIRVYGEPETETIVKFLTEKCQNPLKSINITYGESMRKHVTEEEVEALSAVDQITVYEAYAEKRSSILNAFLEKKMKGRPNINSCLKFEEYPWTNSEKMFNLIRKKYSDRVISDMETDQCTTLRLRSESPDRHILIQYSPYRTYCEVIPAEKDTTNYFIRGI